MYVLLIMKHFLSCICCIIDTYMSIFALCHPPCVFVVVVDFFLCNGCATYLVVLFVGIALK